ncbi:MAG: sigma-70 family RNA polymerase sigma factor [Verrucomicrobiales bacterium]
MDFDPTDEPDDEFVALLTSHQAALRFYVASLLPGCPEVADVTQQANITIWHKRSDFEPGTNFKAWIFAIARYKVLDFRKQKLRDSQLCFSEEMEEIMSEELPAIADDLEARQQSLRECLGQLKPAQRELIQHRYYHRTPLEEYARSIGRSAGGLRVTLHRVRGMLARCIESKLVAP